MSPPKVGEVPALTGVTLSFGATPPCSTVPNAGWGCETIRPASLAWTSARMSSRVRLAVAGTPASRRSDVHSSVGREAKMASSSAGSAVPESAANGSMLVRRCQSPSRSADSASQPSEVRYSLATAGLCPSPPVQRPRKARGRRSPPCTEMRRWTP